jgi:aspartate aminotransferase
MELSERSREAPASPIRKLVPYADAAKARGVHVFHLNIGQPDIPTPQVMWDAIATAGIEVLSYSPSGGIAEFREALIGYYGRHGLKVAPEELLVTTAGSEAILFAMAVVCDPGDEVVIAEPFYANYNGYAAMHPTGRVSTRDEVETLVTLAREHDLMLIADEVYREFCYADEKPISILSFPEIADRAVMVDSLSKRFSACGARIGCLVSRNREVVAAALKFAQARLSPPTLGQVMGTAALALPPSYFDEVLVEYRLRRDAVVDELRKIPGVVCQTPQGAFYVMAKLPVPDAEDFVRWLLEEFQVNGETTMMAPGNGFYATPGAGASEVRIAYVLKEEHLRRAMRVVAEGLEAYAKRSS